MCFQQQEVDKLRLHGLSVGKEALVEVVVLVMPLQGIVNGFRIRTSGINAVVLAS